MEDNTSEEYKQFLERLSSPWVLKYNQPIVNGNQVLNPYTGILEDVGQEPTMLRGPPAIEFFVTNMRLSQDSNHFRAMKSWVVGTMGEFIAGIGVQVKNGLYILCSLNATRFRVSMIIETDMTVDGLCGEFSRMEDRLSRAMFEKAKAEVTAVEQYY